MELDTRNVGQMKDVHMYIEEFIVVDVVTLLYMDEVKMHGIYSSLYTNATIEEKG